ncbi:hypothetical protein H2204_005570 [Knufia peltigerae]|uniref:Uncharacterized protein n=1 Tax=Knufia peltigerae TaxID=1002370 RepID=A0AA38Y5D6_9EURO|nr:hypothetical protein H2204_005570 [Knufia peltigerae]
MTMGSGNSYNITKIEVEVKVGNNLNGFSHKKKNTCSTAGETSKSMIMIIIIIGDVIIIAVVALSNFQVSQGSR